MALRTIECLLIADRVDEARKRADQRFQQMDQVGNQQAVRSLVLMMLGRGIATKTERERLYEDIERNGLTGAEIATVLKALDIYLAAGDEEAIEDIIKGVDHRARGNLQYMEKKSDVLKQLNREEEAQGVQLGMVDRLVHDRRFDEANQVVDRILSNDIGNVDALKYRIKILEAQGDEEAATEVCWQIIDELRMEDAHADLLPFYEKLTIYEPENIGIRSDFIKALAEAGRKREAGLTATMMVDELLESDREEEATQRLSEFVEALPESTDVRLKLAEILEKKDNLPEAAVRVAEAAKISVDKEDYIRAIQFYQRASELQPQDSKYLQQLAEVQEEHGKTSDAVGTLRRLAEVYLNNDAEDEAEQTIDHLYKIAPEDTSSLETMARLYAKRQDKDKQVESLLKLADVCLKKMAYDRALALSDDIEKADPANTEAIKIKVEVYRKTHQSADAIGCLERLAEQHLVEDRHEDAATAFGEILEMDSTNLSAREKLFDLYCEIEKWDEAREQGLALMSAQLRLENFDKVQEIGQRLIDRLPQDTEWREVLYQGALKANKNHDAVNYARSLNLLYKENEAHEKRIKIFRELLELEPDNMDHRAGLLSALKDSGESGEVVVQSLKLAREFKSAGRFNDARSTFENVLEIEPSNESTLIELAGLEAEQGYTEQALERYQKLIDHYRDNEQDDEAGVILEKALKIDKRNEALRRQAIDIALENQNIDAAVSAYIKLYEVYRVEEQRTKALETIKEAVGVKPDNSQLRRYLIDELRACGQEAEAMKAELGLARTLIDLGELNEAGDLMKELASRTSPPPNLEEVNRQLRAAREAQDSEDESDALDSYADGLDMDPPVALGEPSETGRFRRLGPDRPPARLLTMKDLTFDNFVVGNENQFAHATCLAVAKAPAQQYNPLFLWGDVGLGKTHLINAIANHFIDNNPNLSVIYTSTDEFISQLIEAIQANKVSEFRNTFRKTDMLLIDDIQFLSGKERAQEEFFHIFNVLFQSERQIVLTSDRPPKSIAHLEDRLQSRFAAGVIVDMKAPGVETRMAIIKRAALNRGLTIDDDVLNLIVKRIDGNVRELKGAITQICAMSEIGGDSVSLETAQKVLDTLYAST
jgi:chromosomal replication initiator protein DnaA